MSDIFDFNGDYENPSQQNAHTQSRNEYWSQKNERRQQLNAEYQQDLDRYSVNISQEDYNIIKDAIANADVPEDEAYRWACAMELNKQYDMPVAYAYQNLEQINAALWGDRYNFTPKSNFKAIVDSGKLGANTLKLGRLGSKIMKAEMLGKTDYNNYLAGKVETLDDMLAEYAAIEQENVGLQDLQDRNFAIEALKFGAQSAPYTGYVAGVGLLGGLLSGGLGTAASFAAGMDNAAGLEYMRLRQAGSDVGDAAGFAILSGGLQALVETSLGNVAGALGKSSLGDLASQAVKNKITGNVFKRLAYDGTFKTLALKMGKEWVKENAEEGLEEVIQDLIEKGTDALAAELGGYKIEGLDAKTIARDAWENFRGGVMGSLILGLPTSAIKVKADIKEFVNVRKLSEITPSQEAFNKFTDDSVLWEGMSDEEKKSAQKTTWETGQARVEAAATAEAKRIAEGRDAAEGAEEAPAENEEGTIEAEGVARNEAGRLYTSDDVSTDEEGNVTGGTFVVGDKTKSENNRYGYIKYSQDADGNITIDSFKMTEGRDKLRAEAFDEFAREHPDVNIEWNATGSEMQEQKQALIEANPSGAKNGLNYYSTTELDNIQARKMAMKEIRNNIFNYTKQADGSFKKTELSNKQLAAAVTLIESAARRMNMGLAEYINKTFGNQIFGSREDFARASLAQGEDVNKKAGGMYQGVAQANWREVGQQIKAVIYAGEHADFSTWAHEMAHVFQNQLDGDLKTEAEAAFNVQGGDWINSTYKFKDGREMSSAEAFAYCFQDWLETGKAESEQMKNIFQKFAEFIADCYNRLKDHLDFTPEIESVFNKLLDGDDTIMSKALKAAQENENEYRANLKRQAEEKQAAKEAEKEQAKKQAQAEREEAAEGTDFTEEKSAEAQQAEAENRINEATNETEKTDNAIDNALENTNLTDEQKEQVAETLKDESSTIVDKAEATTEAAESAYVPYDLFQNEGALLSQLIGEPAIQKMAESNLKKQILDKLKLAVILEENGDGAEQIRYATGWEKDGAGEWKYETDDSVNKIINKEAILKAAKTGGNLKVKDIYDAEKLYELIPSIKDENVRFSLAPSNQRVDIDKDGIIIFTKTLSGIEGDNSIKSALTEGIQYYIQAYEYAKNSKEFNDKILDIHNKRNELVSSMQKAMEATKLNVKYDAVSLRNRINEILQDRGIIEARNVARRIMYDAIERKDNRIADTEEKRKLLSQEDQQKLHYQTITDPELLEKLNSEPTIKVYRAMQVIDGEYYPPMATVVEGKRVESAKAGDWIQADENPELAIPDIDKKTGKQKVDKDGNLKWKFVLDKGGKDSSGKALTKIPAAYNPYWHTSRSPLNDQFSSAYKRPNLVTVEVEVPASELTSGYKAERAKDAVGEMDWHSGPVSSKLAEAGNPRKVILSRYCKIDRVIPDSEVAQKIKEMLDGTDIAIPDNTVTPSLKAELEKIGVKVEETEDVQNYNKDLEEATRKAQDLLFQDKLTMYGIHNLSEDALRHAVKMGGLANPSMAVVDTEKNSFTNFGEVSLIPYNYMLEKGEGSKGTYGADIYSPRYPDIKKTVTPTGEKKINALFHGIEDQELKTHLTSQLVNKIEESSRHFDYAYSPLSMAYLADKGNTDFIKRKDFKYSEKLRNKVNELGNDYKEHEKEWTDLYKEWRKEELKKEFEGKEISEEEFNKIYNALIKQVIDPETGNMHWGRGTDFVYNIFADARDAGKLDYYATERAARELVENDPDFEKWAKDAYDRIEKEEKIFNGFTPSGNRRYLAHTLENVSKYMRQQELQGGESFYYGLGSTRAKFTPRFTTLQQIKKARDRLVTSEEFEKIKEEYNERFDNIIEALRGDNDFDTGAARFEEAFTYGKGDPIGYLEREYKDYGVHMTDELAQEILDFATALRTMPTEYFETKYTRPVELNEFAGAIIPSNLSQDLKDTLAEKGLMIEEYDSEAGNREEVTKAALQKFNETRRVLFQDEYNPRSLVPNVRGGWTEKKIIKYLKDNPTLSGVVNAIRFIKEFDSPEDLKAHMFYHGTAWGSDKLKPSITMSDRDIERYGGGGYGQKYWSISVSKSKKVASNFAPTSDGVRIYPIILAKNANVIEMPELTDSVELEDHIIDLWNKGVDAVWIGDKDSGEQELSILNPRAVVNIGRADWYKNYRLGSDENPINIKNDEQIKEMFDYAKNYERKTEADFGKPEKPWKKPSRYNFDDTRPSGDKLVPNPNYDTEIAEYNKAMEDYDKAVNEWYSSEGYKNWEQFDRERRNIIFFQNEAEEVRKQYENTDEWMKAPNGEETNLNEDQWVQTRTPAFKNWFKDSKVKDEQGDPLVVYHGTYSGKFDVFDKSKANPENDFGKGFYFTDNDYDVSDNYEGGGPDFENKVDRLAERLQQDNEDLSYEEAKQQARDQLYVDDNLFEVYLSMQDPVYVGDNATDIVGELFDSIDISEEDFEDEDAYYEELNNAKDDKLAEVNEAILNSGYYGAEEAASKVMDFFWNNDYGTLADLKEALNDGSIEVYDESDDNYGFATNDIVRIVAEALGYDGIIDSSVSEKFKNMNIDSSTTHYIVFRPNQIKSATDNSGAFDPENPSILFQEVYHGSGADFDKFDTENYSLSGEGAMTFGYGTYVTDSKDIARSYAERQGNKGNIYGNYEGIFLQMYRQLRDSEFFDEQKERWEASLKKSLNDKYDQINKAVIESLLKALSEINKDNVDKWDNVISKILEDNKPLTKHLYTVEIPDDGYLNWNEELTEEDAIKIANKFINYAERNKLDINAKKLEYPREWSYDGTITGQDLYIRLDQALHGMGTDKIVSRFLNSIGYAGIKYPAGTIHGNGNGAYNYVIFNDDDAKIVDKLLFQTQAELMDEAKGFDSWQEFMEYCETFHADDEVSPIPGDADAQWYQTFWETSNGVKTEEEKNEEAVEAKNKKDGMLPGAVDALFTTMIRSNPEMVDNFLQAVAELDAIDLDSEEWQQAENAEDAAQREKIEQLKDFIGITLSDYNWQTALKRIQGGHEISEGLRKRLIGELTDSFKARDFRALYAEIMNDPQYAVAEEDSITASLNKKLKKYHDIVKPNDDISRWSPERRKQLAEQLANKEIASKIRSGSLKLDDELDAYIKSLTKQIKEKEDQYNELEKETKADYQRIADKERRDLLKLHEQLLLAKGKLNSRNTEVSRKIAKGLKITEKYSRITQNLNANYDELFRKYNDLRNSITINAEVQAALDRQEQLAGIREDLNSKQKEKNLTAEVKKMRIQLVKKAMRRVPFNRVDYESAKTVIAIQRMLEPNLLGGVNRFIGIDSPYLRGVISQIVTDSDYKEKIMNYLSKNTKASQAFADFKKKLEELKTIKDFDSWTAKDRKAAIRYLPKENWVRDLNLLQLAKEREESIDLDIGMEEYNKTVYDEKTGEPKTYKDANGNEHNVTETAFRLQYDEELGRLVQDAVGADMFNKIVNMPFSEWTTEDLESLAQRIDEIYTEGRDLKAAKDEARKRDAAAIRKRIEDAIKETGITINDDDTPEEKERKQKQIEKILGLSSDIKGTEAAKAKGPIAKLNRLLHSYADMNVLRFARMLDGQSEGENVRMLYRMEDECYNKKQRSMNARAEKVYKVMEENGITEGDLAESIKVLDTEFTVDELLYFLAADKDFVEDEKKLQQGLYGLDANDDYAATSRNALMFGNVLSDMFSQEEKESWQQMDKDMLDALQNDTLTQEQKEQQAAGFLDKTPGTSRYIAACHAKWGAILGAAESYLAENTKFKALMDIIEADYAEQYGRMNEVSINEFNMPVHRVKAYVPLVRRESNGDTNENKVREDLLGAAGVGKQWADRGMTQRRVNISPLNQKPVQTGLFRTWADSIERTEHFIAYAPYVRQLNAVYKSRDASYTRRFIESRYGAGAIKYLDEYINEVANPNAGRIRERGAEWLHVLRGKTAPAYLGWKASAIIKQGLTSPWPYMQFVNPAEYTAAALKFTFNPEMREAIKEKSVFMKMRRMDPVNDLIDEMADNAKNKVDRAWSNFSKIGMQGLEMIDWACVAPGWLACYEKKYNQLQNASNARYEAKMAELKERNMYAEVGTSEYLTPQQMEAQARKEMAEDIEAEAVRYADDCTRQCQPSNRVTDLAPLFKNSSEAMKAFLQFQTSLNVIWQNIRYDMPYAVKNKEFTRIAGTVIGYVCAGIFMNSVMEGIGGDDDDDEKQALRNLIYYSTTQFTDSIPIMGSEITNTMDQLITGKRGFYGSGTDMTPSATKLLSVLTTAKKGNWQKAAELTAEGIGLYLGAPVSGAKEINKLLGKPLDEGDVNLKRGITDVYGIAGDIIDE